MQIEPDTRDGVCDSEFDVVVNGKPYRATANTTVSDLIQQLKIGTAVAVEINGELIIGNRHQSFKLYPSARIEIVTLAGGG